MQFEIRVVCSQQSKVSGFTRNRKQEQLLTNAVIAADKIADEQVTLPVQPGQPALVTSQSDHSIRYRVTEACTDAGSCSCPQGTLGYVCKHRVKVIGLLLDCSKQDIVLFLGTWAGSNRGGMQQLLECSSSDTQPELPEHDSWTQLTENLELEDEAEQHKQGITTTGRQTQAASDSALATQLRRTADSEMLAQFQSLLEASRGNADMRNILLAKLNQAEGAFEQLANRNLAGLSLPAQTIGKVQDGLPDSTVRLRSALEGRTKARRKPNPKTAVVTASLPPVVPLPAPQPSRKKRSFAELLTSGRHADKENSSAAANTDVSVSGAADNAVGASSAAANTGEVRTAAGSSATPGSSTVRTATKPPKPAQQPKRRRCGQCQNCLRPNNKQKCLVLAAEKAKGDANNVVVASVAI